jgi:protein-disulfide isomerase
LGLSEHLVRPIAVLLFGALAVACRDSAAHDSAGAPASSTTTAPAAAEALDLILPGVDTSAMTPRERHEWSALVTDLLAPCPTAPVSVAQCLKETRACGTCAQAAKWLVRAVRDGAPEDTIRHAYKERFDPSGIRALPMDGSPAKGPDDAPVVIVEFADFECPHCRAEVPVIDAVLAAHPSQVRLVYKSYTLAFHQRGEPAARAAFAAGMQGKFWEMEHLLFQRQEHLEQSDIDRYAVLLKLDIPKWKADMDSPAVRERIEHDHSLGEDLKLKGTPTLYVNGRELDVEQDESLEGRVAAELGVPPHSPSEAPAASASEGSSALSVADGGKPR